jgi:Hint domain
MSFDTIELKGTLNASFSGNSIDGGGLFGPSGASLVGDPYSITISFDPATLTVATQGSPPTTATTWSGTDDVTQEIVTVNGTPFSLAGAEASSLSITEDFVGDTFNGFGAQGATAGGQFLSVSFQFLGANVGDSLQSFLSTSSLSSSIITALIGTAQNGSINAYDQLTGPLESVSLSSGNICFCRGALIRTELGDTPVECLRVGDVVLTHLAQPRKIVWIGEGRVLVAGGRRSASNPVIVRKGALADNVPNQDLHVTRAHGIYIDDVLIPVEYLVNHRSIVWDDHVREVTIYHVELETHDVLIANGAPAESYRDDGNRWLFQNANSGWHLPPQEPCSPVLTGGPIVDAAWRRLLDRAGPRPGVPLADDPDLRLLVDGKRVDASWRCDGQHVFRLATNPARLRIVSRSAVPQELGLTRDPRPLGVAVRQIIVSRGRLVRTIEASDARLTNGFHGFEVGDDIPWGIRWTDGDADVPAELFDDLTGPIEIVLRLGGSTKYLDEGAPQLAAHTMLRQTG